LWDFFILNRLSWITWQDSFANKLSGVFALGIAFFPTSETNNKTDIISIIHYLSAAGFFITLSIISILFSQKEPQRQ
jgi:hypothetical protein